MNNNLSAFTKQNEELARELEQLSLEFLDLVTFHKDMVENESVILTSLYLEKLGLLQLELLDKQTEASRLKMKMNMIQASINSNEQSGLKTIDKEIKASLQTYYTQILAQSTA